MGLLHEFRALHCTGTPVPPHPPVNTKAIHLLRSATAGWNQASQAPPQVLIPLSNGSTFDSLDSGDLGKLNLLQSLAHPGALRKREHVKRLARLCWGGGPGGWLLWT